MPLRLIPSGGGILLVTNPGNSLRPRVSRFPGEDLVNPIVEALQVETAELGALIQHIGSAASQRGNPDHAGLLVSIHLLGEVLYYSCICSCR